VAFLAVPRAQGVAVDGSLLTVTEGDGLVARGALGTYDIADLAQPVLRQRLDLDERPWHLLARGERGYASVDTPGGAGLALFDRSDPAAWRALGVARFRSGVLAMAVTGQLALAAVAGPDGLLVADLSNERYPQMAAFLELAGTRDLAVRGRDALLLLPRALAFVDLSDPRQPRVTGSWPLPETLADARTMALDGDRLYLSHDDGGVSVIGLADGPALLTPTSAPTRAPTLTPAPTAAGMPPRVADSLWLPRVAR
jgi:hypothetical protein